ncbi:MAG TPA: ATP-binding protein [Steroidobacteraceae bacterium]|jgi:signal transduction histidine kinase/ActR/RegA family two-component response regulator|nr:ATP-binding protein [Steroidobacteraceae bacterium]
MGSSRPDPASLTPAATAEAARREGERRSLRLRLVLIVAVVCAAVSLSTLFDTLQDRKETLALAERQHDNVAGALAEQAARALQATDLILRQAMLLDPDTPGAPDRESIPDLLLRHMSGVPQVRNLFLFDPARQLHLSTAATGAKSDLSDRSYYLAQRAQPDLGLFVSEPFISRATGEPTFVLSRRLPGPGFRGIAGAAVDVAYIRRFYQALDLGPGSSIELLRGDGMTLVSREHAEVSPQRSPWLPALRSLGTAEALHTTIEHAQLGLTQVSLRRVPGYPAVVLVGRGEHDILAVWRSKAWKNLARTLVITMLAALLLIAFLRQLERHERVTAQLHQSQKLEALGTLAGGIAHDFNNVLGAVLGYAELASQQSGPGSIQRRYIDNIVVAANRARELVARILAFSRPGVGSARPVSLQKILSEVHSLTCAALPPSVTVAIEVTPTPLVVAGDASQLHQMLANLITNAVQAAGSAGEVHVRASAVEMSETRDCTVGRLQPGRYACIAVSDTGPGMSAEQVERIFEPFFTTKPVGAGTGLGLSLVHGIVLDHSAALEVASHAGAGTTFSVYLPLTEGEPAQEPAPLAPPRGNGAAILVVDDEESLVALAEEVLASLGYEPVGCVGAQQALKVFRNAPQRFDAVLTDAIMPEMSGLELLGELRQIRPDLAAILVSGYGGSDLNAAAAAAGADAVLMKPLGAVDLAQCLAKVLAGARSAHRRAGFAA